MRSTLILLRHAEPVIGPDDTRPLTTRGRRQACAVVDELVALAPHAFERELGLPRSRTTYTLAVALALDGALPDEAYDQFLERAFPPDSD
ncbi:MULTISPECIES: hypothetical protein [Nocardia]|uniref:Histidine phosphatase family protein n=1 Tax=Nocardia thailandica TaxID=257275 RepID=A0ABW6PWC7_9NOCA|nr:MULTISPECIES: hypothetical protein [Nocardia]